MVASRLRAAGLEVGRLGVVGVRDTIAVSPADGRLEPGQKGVR